MLTWLGLRAQRWVAGPAPWTNVYGLARTLIALATCGTLAFNHSSTLFRPAVGVPQVPLCDGIRQISLFCVLPSGWLEVARWTAVLLLLGVASGWRPRITGFIHWWTAISLQWSGILTDGGDQIASILALLLLPVTLTDGRRWHWAAALPPEEGSEIGRLIARSSWLLVRAQVALIYFHACIGKFQVPEWVDGTALYYWLLDPSVGAPDWLARWMLPLLSHPIVALLTWSVLLLELGLAAGLLLGPTGRQVLLPLGFAFHAGIALFHGLISFVLVMFGALILLLRPFSEEFRFEWLVAPLRRWWMPAAPPASPLPLEAAASVSEVSKLS
ncbi:antimicrobial peptide system protein, SdpB family [Stigmatella aurantiaca]|uniref:Antimicrobial peptide system protein, SdpB family n=1 Tax=Stigmatella aurantiaca TaxID=41 RepID=A0A1H7SV16_STIAU|nr:sporulation-delaying protein SdpB family protein [Stigmatella aurantiaca]SEL76255.1 antimicrobial peptide system protein, SdpB family [Stigmatella aurantiaca]